MSFKVCIIDRRINKKLTEGALRELEDQLHGQGAVIGYSRYWVNEKKPKQLLIGEAGSPLVQKVYTYNHINPKNISEGVLLHKCSLEGNQEVLVVSGSDDKGLNYSIYELADRIRCIGLSALEKDICLEEYPENKVRGVDRYIMNHLDEEWFCSKDFWDYYLKKLVQSRFNRFTLITGFDTAYMTPPYPFFVKVRGYEDVSVEGLSENKRLNNLKMLNYIADSCEEKGIEFSLGSWQQMPWTKTQKSIIKNIPGGDEEFTSYCAQGIKDLIEACPNIKAIQFRVNMESGLTSSVKDGTNTNEVFWCSMMHAIASVQRPVKVDIRAKGATDKIINYALKMGLDVSVATKYWCEHAALPYHIPRLRKEELDTLDNMNSGRRYSYADLLKKPHWYDMIYRLWNYGSMNLFLWGDADYCRRFSKSMRMGDGIGFEINAPLALKGGMEDVAALTPWSIHIHPDMINYRFEDERYWVYYLVFGRYGYNSETDYSVILREFECRFGKDGGYLLAAYEYASRVMPLITTVHFPAHPSLHYWPELYSGAALFAENNYETYFGKLDYGHSLPSDEELFYSIADYVEDMQAGSIKAKYGPLVYRDWLYDLSEKIHKNLDNLSTVNQSKEIFASVVDFTMLADIAEFHAWKIGAAYYLELYRKTNELNYLEQSFCMMSAACGCWERVSENGDKYYNHDLEFNAGTGTKRNKNWTDRLVIEVQKDVEQLKDLLAQQKVAAVEISKAKEYKSLVEYPDLPFSDTVPDSSQSGKDLTAVLTVNDIGRCEDLRQVYLNYRHNNHMEGQYYHIAMKREGNNFVGTVPASYITADYDLIVYFSAVDKYDNAYIYPGVNHAREDFPYYVINIC